MASANSTGSRQAPPFRADQVGSLLRTDRVHNARSEYAAGTITAEQLRSIENEEIIRIVGKQQEVGLTAVTDGEFRRAFWHFDFLEGLDGVEKYEMEGIQFHGTKSKAQAIRVVDKVDFSHHPMLEDFKFLKQAAEGSVAKMTIPSPSMLHYRGTFQEAVYPDLDEFFNDLGQAYAKAVDAFYAAGCRYLQLDDTSWAYFCSEDERAKLRSRGFNPEDLMAQYAKTINRAVANKPADMRITMHICRGNFRSTWIASGGYEPVAETLFQGLNIDGFFLEYDTDRAGGFEPLRFVQRSDLQIVLGLITSKHGALEDASEVKRRIEEATRYVPLEQLCLSPQCGFASTEEGNLLTEDQQWAKLRHVVEIAEDVWR